MKTTLLGVGLLSLLLTCSSVVQASTNQPPVAVNKTTTGPTVADSRLKPARTTAESATTVAKTDGKVSSKSAEPKTQIGRCWKRIMETVRGVHHAHKTSRKA